MVVIKIKLLRGNLQRNEGISRIEVRYFGYKNSNKSRKNLLEGHTSIHVDFFCPGISIEAEFFYFKYNCYSSLIHINYPQQMLCALYTRNEIEFTKLTA